MPEYVKHGGVWREVKPYVRHGGTWKELSAGYVRHGGTWRQYYKSQPTPGSDIGEFFYGGYYGGYNVTLNGDEYALIVSPKASGQKNNLHIDPSSLDPSSYITQTTETDGYYNTYNVFGTLSDHEAVHFCKNLNINGYTDWYLPSVQELGAMTVNLSPVEDRNTYSFTYENYNPEITGSIKSEQSEVDEFKEGGSESFETASGGYGFWSSSYSGLDPANTMYDVHTYFCVYMHSGNRVGTPVDDYFPGVRAMRRELVG